MRERPHRAWHLYVLAVAALALVALAVVQIGPPTSSARTSQQVVTAENGVVQSTVSGSGNVEASRDENVNFQTSGTLQKVYVKAGEHVYAGQLLASLDATSAQLSLDQAKKNLISARDQLKAAQSASTSASSTGSSSSTTASLQTSSSGSLEFVSLSASTTPTTSTPPTPPRPKKKKHHKNKTPTPAQGATTTTTSAAPTSSPTTSTSGSGTASSGSSGSGSTASGSGTSTTSAATKASNIASARASVYSAKANVKSAETALANTKLYAPTSGTIVSLSSLQAGDQVSSGSSGATSSSNSGSSSSSSGSASTTSGSLGGSSSSASTSSSSSSAFAEIVNTSRMTMTVAFSESDISKVKIGEPATITLDALSGVQLGAHVTAISTVGTTSNSVVSYDATLTLDQLDHRVKPGMSASAAVITGQAHGVTVPNAAVSGTASLATVPLLRNGKTVQQQVVVGLKGDSRTQIVSGLKAGDQLVITTTLPSLGSSSSGSSSSGSSSGTLGGGAGGFPGGGFPGGGFPGGRPPGAGG